MAVVKLGKAVKANLGGAHGVMAYVIDPSKTDGGRLVSANYAADVTDPDSLAGPMVKDNENSPQGIRKNSRLAYHLKLSFSPDDPVTPEQVHALGVEFARRITGGEYRFVVATHTDRHHLHDHIVICAAARDSRHLKAQLPKDIIEQWRVIANEICAREGLSVINNPITEAVARRMNANGSGDSKAVKAPGTAAEATSETMPERLEQRRGISMEELYAAAKGLGTKDRIRMLVELSCADSETFEEFRVILSAHGVDTNLRGKHITYTAKDTGFKVRDTKLGPDYGMDDIAMRIGHAPVNEITFNQRLVAARKDETITVWLPGTKHTRKIVLPLSQIVEDGSTLRAYLPLDRKQVILDKHNRYAESTLTPGLYQWFGKPNDRLQPLTTDEKLPVNRGVSPAQRRYYQAQAKRLDRLADEAEALNEAIRWRRLAHGHANLGLEKLRSQVRNSRSELRAAVLALQDAIQAGDKDLMVERENELRYREKQVERYEGDLARIEKTISATRGDDQGTHDRDHPNDRGTRSNNNRRGHAI